jgi:hypothetical protein
MFKGILDDLGNKTHKIWVRLEMASTPFPVLWYLLHLTLVI